MEEVLKNILEEIKAFKNIKTTMTIKEAAEYSGIGRDKIKELVEKKDTDFPYFKNGTKVKINKNLLDAWIDKISKEHLTI